MFNFIKNLFNNSHSSLEESENPFDELWAYRKSVNQFIESDYKSRNGIRCYKEGHLLEWIDAILLNCNTYLFFVVKDINECFVEQMKLKLIRALQKGTMITIYSETNPAPWLQELIDLSKSQVLPLSFNNIILEKEKGEYMLCDDIYEYWKPEDGKSRMYLRENIFKDVYKKTLSRLYYK